MCPNCGEGFLCQHNKGLVKSRETSYPNVVKRYSFFVGKTSQSRQDEHALTIPVRIRPSSSSFFLASHFFSLNSPQHPPPTFSHLLAHANLPQPGPEYFTAHRALWTTPTAASHL